MDDCLAIAIHFRIFHRSNVLKMNISRTILFLLILQVSGITTVNSQAKFSRVQLEIGAGMFTSGNEWLGPSLPLTAELKTQKGIVDFALRFQRSVAGFGVDNPRTSIFPITKPFFLPSYPIHLMISIV
jgi:hypothetical protein